LGKVLERERAQGRRVGEFLEGRSMNRRESGCWERDVASIVGGDVGLRVVVGI
jgi:hypothetical protein